MDLDDDVALVGRTFGIMHDVLGGGRMQLMTWEFGCLMANNNIIDERQGRRSSYQREVRTKKKRDAGLLTN
jgi:hypothetical protein